MSIIITILLTFLATSLFGHVEHFALHQPWSGKVNVAHMAHHQKLYPSSNYLSDVYRDAGKDSTPKFFAVAALPLVLAPIILCLVGVIPWTIMVAILVVELVQGFLHNYLHDAFHIRGHWLYRVPVVRNWFARWVKLHYLHHVNMQTNFGIFTFHWDKLLGTYWRE